MKFQTAITHVNNGQELICGYKLIDLAQKTSFSDTIWLLLRGELPTSIESKMFAAILTIAIDHGPGTISGQAVRIAASGKVSMAAAVIAGLATIGERHGAPATTAAQFFMDNVGTLELPTLLADLKSKKIRLPGFGHAVLTKDHRSETLFAVAKETGFYGQYSKFAEKVEIELNKTASKPLPINVDGSMAAILLDMGFKPHVLAGIFIIARTPGLVAQAAEEMQADAGMRRLSEDEIEYTGPGLREIGV